MLDVGQMRRVYGHGREVFSSIVGRAIWVGIEVRDLMISSSRGSTRSAAGRDIYEKSFIDGLAAGIVGIEGFPNGLLGTEDAFGGDVFVGGLATDDLEGDVRRVDAPTEGIGIFAENDISNTVDEVVFEDYDSGRRGTGSFHPYLSLHCWKSIMTVGVEARDDGDVGRGGTLDDE